MRVRNDRAFTLIEAVLVLMLLAVLLAVAVPSHVQSRDVTHDVAVVTELSAVATQIVRVAATSEEGTLPSGLAGRLGQAAVRFCDAPCEAADHTTMSVARATSSRAVVATRSRTGACWAVVADVSGATAWAADRELPDVVACDAGGVDPSLVAGDARNPSELD